MNEPIKCYICHRSGVDLFWINALSEFRYGRSTSPSPRIHGGTSTSTLCAMRYRRSLRSRLRVTPAQAQTIIERHIR